MPELGRYRIAAVSLALLAPLAACADLPGLGPQVHPLVQREWRLTDVETEGGITRLTPAQSERHRLVFAADGRVTMQLDCNQGNATWNASLPDRGTGTLSFGPVAATRALCPPPSWGEDLALDLPSTTSYSIARDGRTMRVTARRVSFGFAAR